MPEGISWVLGFLKSQLFTSIPYPTDDFSGQTIIVTGSNTGLGLEAARHIVRLGAAKVILTVRTISKGETAAKDIVASCNVQESTVEVWQLDMSNTDSVKAFAKRTETLERLDAAILNAGILTQKFQAIDGVESHLAVNMIGTSLLTNLLLPKLKASAKQTGLRGRLTIVGSDMMYMADLSELRTDGSMIDKLNDASLANMGQRYGLSKILVFYGVREIASRSPLKSNSDVLVNVMTPGACKSDIFRDDASFLMKVMMAVMFGIVARTTEVGGRTLVYAISPKLPAEAHGRFLMDNRIAPDGANVEGANGRQLAKQWNEELFTRLEEIAPGCTRD